MKHFNALATKLAAIAAATAAGSAFAHDGHGIGGTHWHATDVWGFVVVGCLIALALWWSNGDK